MGEVRHYTENGGPEEAYDSDHKAAVEEYLRKGYSAEAIFADCEIRVSGKTYNVLKRTAVTAFYDENGDTIFDVANKRIAAEYEDLNSGAGEPEKVPEEPASDSNLHDSEIDAEIVKEPEKPDAVKKAVEKLRAELAAATEKEKTFAEPCIEHLIKRCGESQSLAEDICQQHKIWEKCYGYVFSKAKTYLDNTSGPVRSDIVFEWVEDYYHLDDKAEEEKKAKEAKEAAERQKKAEERQKQEAKKTTKAAAKPKKPETKSPMPKEEKPVTPKPEAPKKKSRKNELEGQMDLFSMLGM